MTKQRRLILDIIRSNSHAHLTANEIYEQAVLSLPNIAVGTVYRNLNILAEEGSIRRVTVADNPDRFDGILELHDHLICSSCGKLSDIKLDNFVDFLEKQTGIQVLNYNLNISYICDSCKMNQANKTSCKL